MKKATSINIGTSGWSYKHWRGSFYPQSLKEKDYLKYYCKYFNTVEVNNSFYHLLKDETVLNWTEIVPDNFIFSVKANRYITHIKKLKDSEITFSKFDTCIKTFSEKLGVILFQLPPKFSFNPQRLELFIGTIPKDYRYAFEFRDKSWFNSETYDLLKKNNISLCMYNLGEYQSPKELTADFTYIRLHGNYGIGSGKYSNDELNDFYNDIVAFNDRGKDVFCYFNNDEAGFAIQNAFELKEKLNLS